MTVYHIAQSNSEYPHTCTDGGSSTTAYYIQELGYETGSPFWCNMNNAANYVCNTLNGDAIYNGAYVCQYVPPPPLASIAMSGCTSPIYVGKTCQMTATCKDTKGNVMTCPSLTWTTNTNVATVNSNGLVTGLYPGTVTVYAQSGTVIGYAYATIILSPTPTPPPPGSTPTPPPPGSTPTPPPPGTTWTCSCPNDGTNYCVSGTCIPKQYVIYGGIGFGALLLLSLLKK